MYLSMNTYLYELAEVPIVASSTASINRDFDMSITLPTVTETRPMMDAKSRAEVAARFNSGDMVCAQYHLANVQGLCPF